MGHMTRINPIQDDPKDIHNYLPHHAVLKDTSATTKLRVVFDASSATSSGLSLNDVLKIGPKVQSDLFDIVTRMRTHNIVITADIAKMYRMINIHESQRDYQRIVWRNDPDQNVSHFRLNTITYGTSSASFLATRVLHQVGLDCKDDYPRASQTITQDFYMDDLITGTCTLEEAIELKSQLDTILSKSGFTLRKWMSNDMRVFQNNEQPSYNTQFQIKDGQESKTLGLQWDAQNDTLRYTIKLEHDQNNITKRTVLSHVAKIFDPLGLVSPCIIKAKLILQELWQIHVDWDQPIPDSIKDAWTEFMKNIVYLNSLEIPRCILIQEPSNIEIHGFCDSSQVAYGASVYLVSKNAKGETKSNLICAKSRLAPIKAISLPRLELCGAVLLAQLVDKTEHILRLDINKITYWTDSSIVLAWLKSEPNKWKVFVSNRVSEIQKLTEKGTWRHVESSQNPADIVSRGCDPHSLQNQPLWWHGPSWLLQGEEHWPETEIVNISDIPEGRKVNTVLSFTILHDCNIFSRCSTFNKLIRVTAYILRFIHNTRSKYKFTGHLTGEELNQSTRKLCKVVQFETFSYELDLLQQSKAIPKNSKLLTLNPFLDSDGLIRVGGRLKNSNIPFEEKYPIVLPSKHNFTRLLVTHMHRKHLHAGAQYLLSLIRKQFWPLNGRNTIRSALRKCVICFRVKPPQLIQLMGDLPEYRTTPSRPFTFCGIDYAGPYLMKDGKLRSRTLIKIYLCVFVCLTTKAVHVELVTDLTSEGFMNCFKRFASRRGLCKHVYTDNAKNFVGVNNELQKLQTVITNMPNSEQFQSYFNENRIMWHFIPPRSPHFGGMWEAAIKSFKYHIKRVIGDTKLNFEQFYTVVTQIEAILNSRPITPLSSDPSDLQALTPGHFLIGSELTAVPQEATLTQPTNRLKMYKQLQHLVQSFWYRFRNDYLHTLQQRVKWNKQFDNIQIGTLVLIKEDNTPPMYWPLGRVISVHPGSDKVVRVVSVLTNKGIVKRSITKLCPLPTHDG